MEAPRSPHHYVGSNNMMEFNCFFQNSLINIGIDGSFPFNHTLGDKIARRLEDIAMAPLSLPCAYCGTTEIDRTGGHVISKNLYPDSLPNAKRIIVPECKECKALWEDAEPHFRNIMIAIWNPEKIAKDSRYESMKRSLVQCDGVRRFREFTDQLVSVNTPEGDREMIYPAKDSRCNLILRRIVRGLCYHHGFGSAISDARVLCDVMRFRVSEEFQPEFTWHEISPNFFRYGYAIIRDDQFHSVWLLQFSTHNKSFYGAISTSETGFPNRMSPNSAIDG